MKTEAKVFGGERRVRNLAENERLTTAIAEDLNDFTTTCKTTTMFMGPIRSKRRGYFTYVQAKRRRNKYFVPFQVLIFSVMKGKTPKPDGCVGLSTKFAISG